MAYQLWFSPEASRSVSSGPNIATKESNSWVRENQLEDRRRKTSALPKFCCPPGAPPCGRCRAWQGGTQAGRGLREEGERSSHTPGVRTPRAVESRSSHE